MSADGRPNPIPLGTYRRIICQNLRITVPGIWREPPMFINDKGFITLRRPCRLVLLPHDFVTLITKAKFKAETKREKEAARTLLTTLHTVQLDGRGRISIPMELGQALGLKTGIMMVVTASGGWVEIWTLNDWERGRGVPGLFDKIS